MINFSLCRLHHTYLALQSEESTILYLFLQLTNTWFGHPQTNSPSLSLYWISPELLSPHKNLIWKIVRNFHRKHDHYFLIWSDYSPSASKFYTYHQLNQLQYIISCWRCKLWIFLYAPIHLWCCRKSQKC